MYKKCIKRLIDCVLATCGLILLSPLFVILCCIVKLDSKGPVFFRQKRLKETKKEFYILKFRTMKIDTPQNVPTNQLQNPEVYITRMGRLLRKSSMDELPQMINILVGDMSIVGPRPALPNQEKLITQRDKYGANDIKPGLTGWAQVMGRDELSDEEKAAYDGEYVDKISFLFDVKIFFATVLNVLRGDGIVEGAMNNTKDKEILHK